MRVLGIASFACLVVAGLAGCTDSGSATATPDDPLEYLLYLPTSSLELVPYNDTTQDAFDDMGATSNPGQIEPVVLQGPDWPTPTEAWFQVMVASDPDEPVFVVSARFGDGGADEFAAAMRGLDCVHPASFVLQTGNDVVWIDVSEVRSQSVADVVVDAANALVDASDLEDTCPAA